MLLKLPISERSRKYGYIYWAIRNDATVQRFFRAREVVDVLFEGTPIGEKK